eukprot:scaffold6282_cov140-Skeletonema_menzelii.AAC.4
MSADTPQWYNPFVAVHVAVGWVCCRIRAYSPVLDLSHAGSTLSSAQSSGELQGKSCRSQLLETQCNAE